MFEKVAAKRQFDGYRGHVERIFVEWLDIPLRELATDPARVARKHDDVTRENGPYMANGSMRTLRAIYNHARKTNRSLPPDNPADAIDWNEEKRRDTGMGIGDLKGWFIELAGLDNPVRREFHLFMLLSGSRPAALRPFRHVLFTVVSPNSLRFRCGVLGENNNSLGRWVMLNEPSMHAHQSTAALGATGSILEARSIDTDVRWVAI